jgi:hypothetical protein
MPDGFQVAFEIPCRLKVRSGYKLLSIVILTSRIEIRDPTSTPSDMVWHALCSCVRRVMLREGGSTLGFMQALTVFAIGLSRQRERGRTRTL